MAVSSRNFNTFGTNKDEWLTDPKLIHQLGHFDLDPCAAVDSPWSTAAHHYTINDDGLFMPWYGRVWLNPPYGKYTFQWLQKLAEHASGTALIFARTETIGFHDEVFNRAHSVFFFRGRLNFYQRYLKADDGQWYTETEVFKLLDEKKRILLTGQFKWDNPTPANAPSVLVSYSEYDTSMIKMSELKGKLVIL